MLKRVLAKRYVVRLSIEKIQVLEVERRKGFLQDEGHSLRRYCLGFDSRHDHKQCRSVVALVAVIGLRQEGLVDRHQCRWIGFGPQLDEAGDRGHQGVVQAFQRRIIVVGHSRIALKR